MAKRKSGLVLNDILVYVNDIGKSKEFYTKKLGFKKMYGDKDYVSVRTPNNVRLGLHAGGEKVKVRPGSTEFEFQVDNVDVWYDRLRKKGVKFSRRPKDMEWGNRYATFRDPNGYMLALYGPMKTKK